MAAVLHNKIAEKKGKPSMQTILQYYQPVRTSIEKYIVFD